MYEIKTAKVNTLVRCAAAAFASLEVGVRRGRGGGRCEGPERCGPAAAAQDRCGPGQVAVTGAASRRLLAAGGAAPRRATRTRAGVAWHERSADGDVQPPR